jgi:hypothetical protein
MFQEDRSGVTRESGALRHRTGSSRMRRPARRARTEQLDVVGEPVDDHFPEDRDRLLAIQELESALRIAERADRSACG